MQPGLEPRGDSMEMEGAKVHATWIGARRGLHGDGRGKGTLDEISRAPELAVQECCE